MGSNFGFANSLRRFSKLSEPLLAWRGHLWVLPLGSPVCSQQGPWLPQCPSHWAPAVRGHTFPQHTVLQ